MKASRLVQRGYRSHPDWVARLNNVRFVLVGITHAGNIGAIARVMKNMGLRNLTLVSSTYCGPDTDAYALASGAYDIVEAARRTNSLQEALADTVTSVGTSARLGSKRIAARTPAEIVPKLMERAHEGPVACVFGRESKGLSNAELMICTDHMIIPTNSEFASMNVAHAAAVIASEIFKLACMPVHFQARKTAPASVETKEEMFHHVEAVLLRAGFLQASNPMRMMRDIRRILNAAQMDERDVRVVRGIFRKIDNLVRRSRGLLRADGEEDLEP